MAEQAEPIHKMGAKALKKALAKSVTFRTENYIKRLTEADEEFDTVLCLSTAKWLHLNFGDVGVKALFLKVYE